MAFGTKNKRISRIVLALCAAACVSALFSSCGGYDSPEKNVYPENGFDKTLTVATDDDYWPYVFYDENGELTGHDIELITAVANDLEMNLEILPMSWEESLAAVRDGRADAVLTCEYSADNTIDGIVYTAPVKSDNFVIFSKEEIKSSDELFFKVIGVMKDGNAVETIRNHGLYERSIEYPSNREAFIALAKGECDCVIVRYVIGLGLLEELGAEADGIEGYISLSDSSTCIGVTNTDEKLIRAVRTEISKLREEGTLEKLNRKWIQSYYPENSFQGFVSRNRIYIIAGAVLLVALIAFLLYRQQAQQTALDAATERAKDLELINEQKEKLNLQQEKMLEQYKVVERLGEDFECVELVPICKEKLNDRAIQYRESSVLTDAVPGWNADVPFTKRLDLLIKYAVAEEDKEEFYKNTRREVIFSALEQKPAYFVPFRMKTENGFHYMQLRFSPEKGENGEIKSYVVSVQNVDEQTRQQRKQQEALENALDMANSANRAKTVFLSNMSHDIRTPMNAIIGFTDMAKKHIDDKERVEDCLDKVKISGEHLLSLINDVLDMSRIESGKMTITEAPEDLAKITEAVAGMVQADVNAKKLSFSADCSQIVHKDVMCDRLRLNRVILNVVSNSVKYTPEGGSIKLDVTETEQKKDGAGHYVITVSDTGMGMSEEFLKEIFEPFTRVRTTTVSGIQGTGLGMAITKSITDMMGGTIDVKSKVGEGTTVTLGFDFAFAPANEAAHEKAISADTSEIFAGKTILLVEDNEMNREIACEILGEYGIKTDSAEDGTVAVEKMKNASHGQYDLVLMDIQMPKMDGYEATKQIRALDDSELANTPIVAMTANAFDEDRRAALEAGMNEHIAKPIDMDKLKAVMTKFL